MSWFEQITAKAAQIQSLEELETAEARDKFAQGMFLKEEYYRVLD